jgi:hypothetical protein
VAIIPPVAGVVGVVGMMRDSDIILNGKQVGPEFDKLVAKEAPMGKIESFVALGGNTFSCLLLIGGSVCLFMAFPWGKWVCVAGAFLMILFLLIHDVYQIFFYRAALMTCVDRVAAPIEGFPMDANARNLVAIAVGTIKTGMTMYTLAWSCTNPLIMGYLFVMALCMAFMNASYVADDVPKSPRRRDREDDDDDRPKKKRPRGDDDEMDDERPSKPKKKRRDGYEED